MKERPIIMNAEMVRAILDETKTQTRRIIKPQPSCFENGMPLDATISTDKRIRREIICPYGISGDNLWVRETFTFESNLGADIYVYEYSPPFNDGRPVKWEENQDQGKYWWQPHYKATDPVPALTCHEDDCQQCEKDGHGSHWKPSIHMPRWASRIILEITDVRVERLNDISEEDAKKEGIKSRYINTDIKCCSTKIYPAFPDKDGGFHTAKEAFEALWESIYGEGSWNVNPWVWCISFRRINI